MADSSFWRDLANQFRALPLECKMVRADRYPVDDDTNELGQWQLDGTATGEALVDALARRAASEIENPPSHDLLESWLEVLITRGGVQFHSQTISTGNNKDGTPRAQRTIGHLYELPQHSANYCKILESAALQTEHEEKQRSDPKNLPPIVQWYKTFKKLKELQNVPPEDVPEKLVRDVIAGELGIKPEDVTFPQIRFQISRMLPFYPSIRLIPSVKSSEQDPKDDSEQPSEVAGTDAERRERLLAEYKEATGFPSNKSIYEATNCPIHKPQFYKWLKGSLPADSATTINFERFLKDKRRPSPQKK